METSRPDSSSVLTPEFDQGAAHRRMLLFCLGAAFLVYAVALRAPAQFDDRHVWSAVSYGDMYGHFIEATFPRRLLVNLTFMWSKGLFGSDPMPYRLLNVAIHAVAGYALYRWLLALATAWLRWGSAEWGAGGAARPSARGLNGVAMLGGLIFVVHPLAVTSVTYVAQRYTSMAGMWMLLALWGYTAARLALEPLPGGEPRRDADDEIERFAASAARRRRGLLAGAGALVATVAAMLSKEYAVVTPIVIGLVELAFFERGWDRLRQRVLGLVPFAATLLVFAWAYFGQVAPAATGVGAGPGMGDAGSSAVVATATGEPAEEAGQEEAAAGELAEEVPEGSSGEAAAANLDWSGGAVSRSAYLAAQVQIIPTLYFRLLVWPVGQSIYHEPQVVMSLASVAALACAAGLTLLLLAGLWLLRRHPFAGLGVLLPFLVLGPTSSLVPNSILAAEQRAYLCLATPALLLMAAWLTTRRRASASAAGGYCAGESFGDGSDTSSRTSSRTAEGFSDGASVTDAADTGRRWVVAGGLALLVLAALTVRYNLRWNDEVATWRTAVEKAPASARAWSALGYAYELRGAWAESEQAYRRAIELSPTFGEPHNNLGNVLLQSGRPAEAVASFEQAARISPSALYATNLLVASNQARDYEGTVRRAEHALKTFAQEPQMWYELALAQHRLGRFDVAEANYRHSLELRPGFLDARFNLAVLAQDRGDAAEAYQRFMAVLGDHPGHVPSMVYAAMLLAERGQLGQAETYLRIALQTPSAMQDQVHRRLGEVLAAAGKPAEAIAEFREALTLNPADAAVHAALAKLLQTTDPALAARHAAEAARLRGQPAPVAPDAPPEAVQGDPTEPAP